MILHILFNDKLGQHVLSKVKPGGFLTLTFQALGQDLLHVSERLESLEDQVRRCSSERQTGGATMEELEEERDMLKKRRDALDVQLKDNSLLPVEVRWNTGCVGCKMMYYQAFFHNAFYCSLVCLLFRL